jgi:hypothetical protein
VSGGPVEADKVRILAVALGFAIVGTVLVGVLIQNKLLDNRLIPRPSGDPFMPGAKPPMLRRMIEHYDPRTYNAKGKRLLAYSVLVELLFGVQGVMFLLLLARNW